MSNRDDAPAPREAPLPVVDLGFGDAEGPPPDPLRAAPVPPAGGPAPESSAVETPSVAAPAPVAEAPDKRVRELIKGKELKQRRRIGERTLRRVGGRSWERPNVCFSDRLFKRLGANDPWDPDGGKRESKPVGLGPVGLKLGDKRRQPAPHLRPKTPKGKKKPQEVDPIARFRNLPPAPSPSPAPAPRPAPRPPAAAPSAPAPEPPRSSSGRATNPAVTRRKLSGEFGGSSGPKPLVGKLPMRPELAAEGEGAPPPAGKPGAPTARGPETRPAARAPARAAPARPARQSGSRTPSPAAGEAPRKPVRPPTPKIPGPPGPSRKRRSNRFRLKPTEARGPVIREVKESPVKVIELVDEGSSAPAPVPAPAPAPVNRSAPTGPLGLDDLFGGGGGGEKPTRMRIRRSKKTSTPEDGGE